MRRGFSLVELSIVLVILGLLVGSVLSGQALIRAAQLRSVSSDYMRYKTAIYSFRDKYFALAGDMPNATQFWGSVGGVGHEADPTCWDTLSTDAKTCNGDGNGYLDNTTSPSVSNAGSWYYNHENLRFWQHLANAGLIEGSFAGSRGASDSLGLVAGKNLPQSKISGASYFAYSIDDNSTSGMGATLFASHYGNIFEFSDISLAFGAHMLNPQETYNLDMKLDDGVPSTGFIMTDNGACVSSATSYALTQTTNMCRLYLKTGTP